MSPEVIPLLVETKPLVLVFTSLPAVRLFLASRFLQLINDTCQLTENGSNITTIADCSINIGAGHFRIVSFKVLKSSRQSGFEPRHSIFNVLRYSAARISKLIGDLIIKNNVLFVSVGGVRAGRHNRTSEKYLSAEVG